MEIFKKKGSSEKLEPKPFSSLSDSENRKVLVFICAFTQIICVILSYFIIFSIGYGWMDKSNFEPNFLKWLITGTLITTVSNTVFIYKNLFPNPNKKK